MRRHTIASQILLILSIFSFVLAAPVAVQPVREINEVRVNAVDVAKVAGMAASEKRMDPGDRESTNAGYLTDESVTEWNTISSDSTGSAFSESDTATSRPTVPTGSQGSPDDSPSHPGPAGNPLPSHPVSTGDPPPPQPEPAGNPPPSHSTGDPPPSQPGPAGDPPPSQPEPAGNPPPSQPGPAGDHSPPSAGPQHPGAPESENFFVKLMKGKFKRRISGYGPGN